MSRADDFALSLLSSWSGIEEKYLPWQDSPSSVSLWDNPEFLTGLDRYLSTRLAGIPYIAKGAVKEKEKKEGDKEKEGEESQANLTARLVGTLLEMDGSLAGKTVSRALCRLSPNILLPICCSGPISRCVSL